MLHFINQRYKINEYIIDKYENKDNLRKSRKRLGDTITLYYNDSIKLVIFNILGKIT